METLYLHHERAIGRRALFLFADGGEGPAGGGDGLVEASELQVLIFPEFGSGIRVRNYGCRQP